MLDLHFLSLSTLCDCFLFLSYKFIDGCKKRSLFIKTILRDVDLFLHVPRAMVLIVVKNLNC